MMRYQKGFTLIELVIVIGILALLFGIALVAINPAKQFAQANNTKRTSDVKNILDAINQYQADNKGALPAAITTSLQTIAGSGGADLCPSLIPKYIAAMPIDPLTNNGTPLATCNSTYNTRYTVVKSVTNNRVTVAAPSAELGVTITVTR